MKQCTVCKQQKELTEFYRNRRMKSGVGANCKQCADEKSAASRRKNPTIYAQSRLKSKIKSRNTYMEEKRNKGCACCDETEPICLEYHHTDPTQKEVNPTRLRHHGIEKRKLETDKCILVCSNCHKKIHAKIITHTRLGQPVFHHNAGQV